MRTRLAAAMVATLIVLALAVPAGAQVSGFVCKSWADPQNLDGDDNGNTWGGGIALVPNGIYGVGLKLQNHVDCTAYDGVTVTLTLTRYLQYYNGTAGQWFDAIHLPKYKQIMAPGIYRVAAFTWRPGPDNIVPCYIKSYETTAFRGREHLVISSSDGQVDDEGDKFTLIAHVHCYATSPN